MPIIDCVVIALLLYFLQDGWRKGLLGTLLGPAALVISLIAGFVYYQQTKNLAVSLLIWIAGPFLLKFLLLLPVKFSRKKSKGKKEKSLSTASQILGGLFNVGWGGSYVAVLLLCIGLAPFRFGWFAKFQDFVITSHSYGLLKIWTKDAVPEASMDIEKITTVFSDPDKLKHYESTPEYQALMEDEILRKMYTDDETAEQFQSKNYAKLLANPKVQAVFQDEELIRKIFALNKRIMEDYPAEATGPTKPPTPPRVIDIK